MMLWIETQADRGRGAAAARNPTCPVQVLAVDVQLGGDGEGTRHTHKARGAGRGLGDRDEIGPDAEGHAGQDLLQFRTQVPFAAAYPELRKPEAAHSLGHRPVRALTYEAMEADPGLERETDANVITGRARELRVRQRRQSVRRAEHLHGLGIDQGSAE